MIARTARRSAFTPREAYQRGFHIVKQGRPGSGRSLSARNEHIVGSGLSVEGQQQAGGCAQSTLGAIARHGIADFLGRRKPGPGRAVAIILADKHLNDHGGFGGTRRFSRA
nr:MULTISPECIES: hypothetical protein [unclassified Oceanicaulis]